MRKYWRYSGYLVVSGMHKKDSTNINRFEVKRTVIVTGTILTLTISTFVIYLVFNPPCFGLGCTGDYSFQDTVTFTAPKSGIQMIVASSGYVPDGADVGEGRAFVKLFSIGAEGGTLLLKTSSENDIDTIIYKGKFIPFNHEPNEGEKFYDCLLSVGFEHLDKNEVLELQEAMTLINYGHKQGFTEGQTKFITVHVVKPPSPQQKAKRNCWFVGDDKVFT